MHAGTIPQRQLVAAGAGRGVRRSVRRRAEMLRNARAAILALGLSACSTPAPLALAITDVHVVDVETGRVCRDRTILIVGDRITAVGDARRLPVPTGARVLAGDGAFVIPGLV
ncbi:MAG: hypothetical protein KAI24_15785, partial [Planctomycetes bacterium]|nr:hypothetical protein [Planctomycetota bacterium]